MKAKTLITIAVFGILAVLPLEGRANLDEEKLVLERQRLELDERRVKVSFWNSVISAAGIAIPLLVAAISLGVQVRNRNRQDKLLFQAKAAEIAMNTDNPEAARNRARAVAALFPEHLNRDFANQFDPEVFRGSAPREGGKEAMVEFFKTAASGAKTPAECAELWMKIFPRDTWAEGIK